MTDEQLASRVREELYFGCVDTAEQFASSIQNEELRQDMEAEIRRYEGNDE